MHTIKIDISDSVYDKVISFLQKLPQTEIKLHTEEKKNSKESLVDFFQSSPLRGVAIERGNEIYQERVSF